MYVCVKYKLLADVLWIYCVDTYECMSAIYIINGVYRCSRIYENSYCFTAAASRAGMHQCRHGALNPMQKSKQAQHKTEEEK